MAKGAKCARTQYGSFFHKTVENSISLETLWAQCDGRYKAGGLIMLNLLNTDYEGAAKLTVSFVDHGKTPDQLSEAILEKLIVMADESKINIWHKETGLNINSLAALYRLYETGAGYHHSRTYANYELGRKKIETP